MKSQSIASLLSGRARAHTHTGRNLDLEGEVHSTWDLWISGLRVCKGNSFLEVGWDGHKFSIGSRKSWFLSGAAPARIYLPRKARGGGGGGLTPPPLPHNPKFVTYTRERAHDLASPQFGETNGEVVLFWAQKGSTHFHPPSMPHNPFVKLGNSVRARGFTRSLKHPPALGIFIIIGFDDGES